MGTVAFLGYKIQEYAGRPRRKRSEGKATWPGRKQVFRSGGDDGVLAFDTLLLEGEKEPGTPLLVPVMRNGSRMVQPTPLMELRRRVATEVARLPGEPPMSNLLDSESTSFLISVLTLGSFGLKKGRGWSIFRPASNWREHHENEGFFEGVRSRQRA